MTNIQGRVGAGVPAGGQFTGRTYTEGDIALIEAAASAAATAANVANRQYALANARVIAANILKDHPTAATVRLVESDQEGSSWFAEAVLDVDGNELDAQEIIDDLSLEFSELPPNQLVDAAGDPDAAFNWIQVTRVERAGYEGEFDVRLAAGIGEEA